MTPRPALITIRAVRPEAIGYLEFSAPGIESLPDMRVDLLDPDAVFDARKALDRKLTELKDLIAGLDVTDAEAAAVYDKLWRTGNLLMFTIFQDLDNVDAVLAFWQKAMLFRTPGITPLVQCVGDMRTLLPIEYLPLLAPGPRKVTTRAELITACRDFVGFSAIVRRSFAEVSLTQELALRSGPEGRLPVRFLRHDGLAGAARELKWFTETARDHVEVERPYPTDDEDADEPELSEMIGDPCLSLTGVADRPPDQIQHFACHCYTRADDTLGNEIELSSRSRTIVTRLDDLGIDLTARRFGRRDRTTPMPLVVMNACGASRMSVTSSLSFPALFLRNKNRGFIGSDIEIPDDVAAEFSEAFYTAFILGRRPLGEAVHHARNHLLARFGNPLGLGYSAYADPDLHIIDTREGS